MKRKAGAHSSLKAESNPFIACEATGKPPDIRISKIPAGYQKYNKLYTGYQVIKDTSRIKKKLTKFQLNI